MKAPRKNHLVNLLKADFQMGGMHLHIPVPEQLDLIQRRAIGMQIDRAQFATLAGIEPTRRHVDVLGLDQALPTVP